MILDISDLRFREIFDDPSFHLPIRWDGKDFSMTLDNLFDRYTQSLEKMYSKEDTKDIKRDCELIVRAVNHYLNGYPDKAYKSMETLMPRMMNSSVGEYFRTEIDEFRYGEDNRGHPLYLFRATAVPDNQPYPRERIFHTPYSMRSRVSTNRYSMQAHPFDSGDPDCKTVLDQIYQAYAESHENDPPDIQSGFAELETHLGMLPLEDNNAVFNLCCRLCVAYE